MLVLLLPQPQRRHGCYISDSCAPKFKILRWSLIGKFNFQKGNGGYRNRKIRRRKFLASGKNATIKRMVKAIEKNDTKYYQCEECGLLYADKETGEKCQAWCAEHKSCNLEIIKHAAQDSQSQATG